MHRARLAVLTALAVAAGVVGWQTFHRDQVRRTFFDPGQESAATGHRSPVTATFECNRCHDHPAAWHPAPRALHCVECHQAILAGEADGVFPSDAVDRWKSNIHSLVRVPSLVGMEHGRLRRDWLIAFLQTPHDLRPGLGAMMPRLPIDAQAAVDLADALIPPGAPALEEPVPAGDRDRGVSLLNTRGCISCHAFSGGPPVVPSPVPGPLSLEQERWAGVMAPDLRFTRARMTRAAVLRWLEDPGAIKADALMPRIALTSDEQRDVVAALFDSPLAPAPISDAPAAARRLPVLKTEVRWHQVEQRIFKKVCWHCHSDPEPVGGNGGPGNTGGFGFRGAGLDLGSYRGFQAGRLGPDRPDGMPRVVRHLLARHDEVAGRPATDVLGMPLGLPPLPWEDIQLLETWLAQGARE